ncbi:hypothetical protein MSBRW_0734 [Methanosarcina barkeri str. Wiesmoor]|uniref:Uncharacterized protein n=2 Tax=Methanosarcina barkeri TaxID=2208 RepID=A0A0E3QJP6_METBA|nr:hypothetical protein [Methanosarcina barkeri]AKB49987.1 hypothetical protein MSBRW_0734 [Methanosarcina barkeri str. Wiesmoor]
MDIIKELNLYYCRTSFQKAGKSEYTRSVNLGQGHLQYRLKLQKTDKIRDRKTKASLSGLRAMTALRLLVREDVGVSKVLTDRMLACQKIKA